MKAASAKWTRQLKTLHHHHTCVTQKPSFYPLLTLATISFYILQEAIKKAQASSKSEKYHTFQTAEWVSASSIVTRANSQTTKPLCKTIWSILLP